MRISAFPFALALILSAACGPTVDEVPAENILEVFRCDSSNCPEAALLCLSVEHVDLAAVEVVDRPGISTIKTDVDEEGFDGTGQPACYPFRTPNVVTITWDDVEVDDGERTTPNPFELSLEAGDEAYVKGRYGIPPPENSPDDDEGNS